MSHNTRQGNIFGSKRGVTLIEVMLAGAITTLVALSFFKGITVAARFSRENKELLTADAYAWDEAWRTFNSQLPKKSITDPAPRILTQNEAPALYREGSPAECYTILEYDYLNDCYDIYVNVEWGTEKNRKRLNTRGSSDGRSFNHTIHLYRSSLSRVEKKTEE